MSFSIHFMLSCMFVQRASFYDELGYSNGRDCGQLTRTCVVDCKFYINIFIYVPKYTKNTITLYLYAIHALSPFLTYIYHAPDQSDHMHLHHHCLHTVWSEVNECRLPQFKLRQTYI